MSKQINRWLEEAREHAAVGRSMKAEKLCHQILDAVPNHTGAMLELARSLYFRRQLPEAIPIFASILELEPDNSEARTQLLYCQSESGDYEEATNMARAIVEYSQDPDELLAAYMAFDAACDWEQTENLRGRILDLALAGRIKNSQLSNLMMSLNAAPGVDPDRIYALHKQWGDHLMRTAKSLHLHGRTPPPIDGRLKIAYLSTDFFQHPVGHFIQVPITHHDRHRFEVYCYARLIVDDTRTAHIRETADHFVDVTGLSPVEMAQRIRDDGIHILIELGGHTALSCVSALALKPAPVQITYLGYPNTTGLAAVDFRITDIHAEDTEHGTRYIEKLLTMPQSFLCAIEYMIDVQRTEITPASRKGYITFGSFNHVRKLNPETIALWSRILQRVEGSRFLVKSKGCDHPVIRENILAEFVRHGIDADRIDFHSIKFSHAEHTAFYNEVDIALDSFPYNGTTTTCETLWMGVPVVTLVGPQHVQRTSYSILKNVGLDATIAHSPDEYVDKAVNLSGNLDNLTVLRQCLPALLKHSPLGQPEAFTRQLESLYLDAWQEKTGVQTMASILSATAADKEGEKRPLRIIHNLARSGSTLMCKCLGSMQGIDLLSEIHPLAVEQFNPLDQAHEWFGLLTPEDIASLQTSAPSFTEAIRLIERRSRERGEALVIRDWAHLDFVGQPFLPTPTFRLGLAQALAGAFALKQIAFVRHPIDLWLSLSRLETMQQAIASGSFGIDEFIHGYLCFARQCAGFGLIRYEDFTRAPGAAMRAVCEGLDLPYDPAFIDQWNAYTTITGDVVSTRGGNEIKPLERREMDDATLARFTTNPEYRQLIDILGYEDTALETGRQGGRQGNAPDASAPVVTVLVFAYNHEPFIRQAIHSLFAQDYQGAMEIIISDDASSDRTADIIEEEVADYHGPFSVRFNRNRTNSGGIVPHINQLMAMARGRLIVSAAGDDVYLPYCVRRIVDAWGNGAHGSVFRANPSLIDEAGKRLGRKFLAPEQEQPELSPYRDMIAKGLAEAWCIAWDRAVFDVFGPMPENTRNEDQLIPFRGALLKGYRFIPGDFVEYRTHQHNLSIWRKLQLADSEDEREAVRAEAIDNAKQNLVNWIDALRCTMDAKRMPASEARKQIEALEQTVADHDMQLQALELPRNLPLKSEAEIMAAWSGDPDEPLASICCAVFNHEQWIHDALHGFLSQETDFPFEIIFRDDASTDDSTAIINAYAERYPNIIRLQVNAENRYAYERQLHAWPRLARGRYIALCEGDDFWTAKDKLQKQVGLMEAHPKTTMCLARTHLFENYDDGFTYKGTTAPPAKTILELEDVQKAYGAHTSTYVMRASTFKEAMKLVGRNKLADTELMALMNSYGPFAMLNEAVSVYRITGKGVWTSLDRLEQLKQHYEAAQVISRILKGKHREAQIKVLKKLSAEIAALEQDAHAAA